MCHVFQHCGTNCGHCKLKLTQIKTNVGFLRSGENRSTGGKLEYPGEKWSTRQSRKENQQTQHTYDAESGNRTRGTLARSECSHHYCPGKKIAAEPS